MILDSMSNYPVIKKMLFYLILPFLPRSWLVIANYDKAVDENLENVLKSPNITDCTEFYATINGQELWCASTPHNCGMTCLSNSLLLRPSRYNMYRFSKLVNDQVPNAHDKVLKEAQSSTEKFKSEFCLNYFNMNYDEVLKTLQHEKPEKFI